MTNAISYFNIYESQNSPKLDSYYLNISNNKKYKTDDTVKFEMHGKDGIITNNKGKLLMVFYKEGLVDTKIVSNNDFSFKFKDDYFPGLYVTGVYLIEGKLYETSSGTYSGDFFPSMSKGMYLDYDEKEKVANINIKTNKETYSPGEEVELSIKVTDKNNKRLKTELNISVVDEAIFEMREDDTSILETIYSNRYFKEYQVSTDRVYRLGGGGGGDASGGAPRYNFKDTAYFTSLSTNNSGEAKVRFKLPDNITRYRITVHAASKDEKVGVTAQKITSTKEFFVESPIPTNVKYTDDFVINAISHQTGAKTKTKFTFKLDDKELISEAAIDKYATANSKSKNSFKQSRS